MQLLCCCHCKSRSQSSIKASTALTTSQLLKHNRSGCEDNTLNVFMYLSVDTEDRSDGDQTIDVRGTIEGVEAHNIPSLQKMRNAVK